MNKRLHLVADKILSSQNRDSVVVDLCGGRGDLVRFLRSKGFNRLYLVDKTPGTMSRVISVSADVEDFVPLPDRFADVVVLTSAIEHMKCPFKVLNQAFRLLKSNGFLFLTTHNTHWFAGRLKFLFGGFPSPNLDVSNGWLEGNQHLQMFSRGSLRSLLLNCGFRVVDDFSCLLLAGNRFVLPLRSVTANWHMLSCEKILE